MIINPYAFAVSSPSSLLTDLVSYWKMDEASGNAIDSHGSNDLTDNNTVGSASGKVGNARDFESGNDEYFSLADNTDISVDDIDFTFAVWVNAESLLDNIGILGKWSNEYALLFYSSRFIWAAYGSSGQTTLYADNLGVPSTGTWYLIVVWHDSVNNEIAIQVNNGTPNTSAKTDGVANGVNSFVVGRYVIGSTEPWDGLIDEVGFWKRVLTAPERTQLYNSGNGVTYPSFV